MAVLLTISTKQEELAMIQVLWAEGVTDVNIHFEDTFCFVFVLPFQSVSLSTPSFHLHDCITLMIQGELYE
jgi:hypothetical protein